MRTVLILLGGGLFVGGMFVTAMILWIFFSFGPWDSDPAFTLQKIYIAIAGAAVLGVIPGSVFLAAGLRR